ncbi:hypothetical protein CPJCM30710_06480 [Clostridium polyendosporum]|uniref:POTRA domain-containing protein n=1 Tax=Clostridium polyendosporum TaxID=69208 RepID=A0A919RXA5_9CLOT|nr:FtsQ-type POTRA domain-containing protein [Clostridium polyendosporum]GIM27982.1 hypothetical protein CPJCM30710_06480 [Clostridium polyendosporum]
MDKDISKFINNRKKRKKIKKAMLFFILFLALFILLLGKAPFFNVKQIIINNNKIIDTQEILKLCDVYEKNIFYINTKDLTDNIKTNPYIENVALSRILPDKLVVKVEERKAIFYIKLSDGIYVLSPNLTILEKRQDIEGLNLIELIGVDGKPTNVGENITSNVKQQMISENIGEFLQINDSNVVFSSVDIKNPMGIVLNYNDIKILVGNDENLKPKLNTAINVLLDENIGLTKGYIDVSFNGSPVIKQEGGS